MGWDVVGLENYFAWKLLLELLTLLHFSNVFNANEFFEVKNISGDCAIRYFEVWRSAWFRNSAWWSNNLVCTVPTGTAIFGGVASVKL